MYARRSIDPRKRVNESMHLEVRRFRPRLVQAAHTANGVQSIGTRLETPRRIVWTGRASQIQGVWPAIRIRLPRKRAPYCPALSMGSNQAPPI